MRPALRPMLSASSLAVVLTLSGCGKEILDWRNAQLSNGKVYSGSANTPFSGAVTNVPYGKVLNAQPGFQALMGQGASIVTMLYGSALLCDINVEEGALDGDFDCKQPQGKAKIIEGRFDDGALAGKLIMRDAKTETVVTETTFKDGRLDGTLKRFDPETKALVLEQSLSNGVAEGPIKQWNAKGDLLLDATYSKGLLDGKFKQVEEQRQQITEGQYKEGHFTGTKVQAHYFRWRIEPDYLIATLTARYENDRWTNEEEYRATLSFIGDIERCVDWADDALKSKGLARPTDKLPLLMECKNAARNGPKAQDRASAAPVAKVAMSEPLVPQADEDRMSFPDESNACTVAWQDAFRKENGEESIINFEQAWEFVDNCRAGKRP